VTYVTFRGKKVNFEIFKFLYALYGLKIRAFSMTPAQISKKIISDMHRLGIAKGDVIMVHSSIKSLGKYDLVVP